jgi:hypothetical protein
MVQATPIVGIANVHPGRLRTASSPLSTLMLPELYSLIVFFLFVSRETSV